MGKNRDRISIIADILNAANSGCSKTRIMSQANLSFSLLEKYLSYVIELDFINIANSKYILTNEGREFLKQYRHFEEKYSKANQTMETLIYERERLVRIITKKDNACNFTGLNPSS